VLLIAPVVFLVLFLVAPILFMVALSVRPDLSGQLLAPFDPTLEHYQQLVDTPSFLRLLLTSAGIAALVALAATGLAYPLAYYLRFRAGTRGTLLLFLLLLPFWTSYLLRVVAWRVLLGTSDTLPSTLHRKSVPKMGPNSSDGCNGARTSAADPDCST
jgi:spermidine/putrescine transport system permease protein